MKTILLVFLYFLTITATAQISLNSVSPITGTSIGKYEKFEVGIQLSTTNFINQFNPDEIEVYAIFTFTASAESQRTNAFWFQDFDRHESSPDPTMNDPCDINAVNVSDPNFLSTKFTPLPWRIRFSPDAVGVWNYRVYVKFGGQTISSVVYSFTCTRSEKNGFIGVGSNRTHFVYTKTGNPNIESGFLPLGLNVSDKGSVIFNRAGYLFAKRVMQKMASTGGNTIRIWMTPEQYGLEWNEEGLGRYFTRQNRAFNLDDIFNLAEELGIKIQLVLMSNHEFHDMQDGAQAGYNYWNNNPYKPLIASQFDYFTNSQCFEYAKRKFRYVIARWGYSPTLLSYEIWNEVDHMVNANPNFWGNNNSQKVKDWHANIITYAKSLDKKHMFTTSVTAPICGDASGTDNVPFFNSTHLDYVQDHYYSNDMNVTYNYSVFAQHAIKKYNKPYITGEFGSVACWLGVSNFTHSSFTNGNYAHDYIDFHNGIWSSLFNGSAGPAYTWDTRNLFNECWGGAYKELKPLASFIQNDDFFTKDLVFKTNKPLGNRGVKDDPLHNSGNNSLPTWSYVQYSVPTLLSYINYGITTSNDRLLDVFAAQSDDGRVQGWVHNRKNYWYELPHSSGDPNSPLCQSFNDNQPSSSSSIPMLDKESFTLSGISCDGWYKVDFYSTYSQYDINGDNVLDDGGKIIPFTQYWLLAHCGNLTVPIPTLGPISSAGLYAPDYAFKISKIHDDWSHALVTGGVTQINRMSNHTSVKNYYSDNVGAIRSVTFDNTTNTFSHGLISPASPFSGERSFSAICANGDGSVFYRGDDSRLHQYYFENGVWNHIWMTDWNNNSQNVGGNITIGGVNLYYEGIDNRIHRYKYVGVGTWEHSILPNPSNDMSININGGSIATDVMGTQVYYKGIDGRLQSYYLDNNNTWNHIWLTDWNNSSQNVYGAIKKVSDGVFYAGLDGKLHLYHYNFTTSLWEHQYVLDSYNANQPISISPTSDISIQGDGDQIFFKGSDNLMHHLFDKNNNYYAQDFVLCYDDLNNNYKPNGSIVTQSDGSTLYIGASDNFIHMYSYDSGCTPRERKTGKKTSETIEPKLHKIEKDSKQKIDTLGTINAEAKLDEAISTIRIFPNPFSNQLTIETGDQLGLTVKILDIYGKDVFVKPLKGGLFIIETKKFLSGVYIVIIMSENGIIKKEKLVKL